MDWLFRNRETGAITVAQFPNLPLWIFLGTVVGRTLLPGDSNAFTALRIVALAALGWWAVDEVLTGGEPVATAAGAGGERLRDRGRCRPPPLSGRATSGVGLVELV